MVPAVELPFRRQLHDAFIEDILTENAHGYISRYQLFGIWNAFIHAVRLRFHGRNGRVALLANAEKCSGCIVETLVCAELASFLYSLRRVRGLH